MEMLIENPKKKRLIQPDDLHVAIQILKEELLDKEQMRNYALVAKMVSESFDYICTVKQIADYFNPHVLEDLNNKENHPYYNGMGY